MNLIKPDDPIIDYANALDKVAVALGFPFGPLFFQILFLNTTVENRVKWRNIVQEKVIRESQTLSIEEMIEDGGEIFRMIMFYPVKVAQYSINLDQNVFEKI